ncbi:efflux transporter outer membrane subunit [Paraburkholderia sp. C35]|uniref:efflux transporter outer membrane subunit n=1 Tax=Paraburkholderia sp. C35 TaxID=2126993 RepID=UPI000D69BA02|nr:efflux transporter outer membrane subunit [Paraburkholderia sp. C35]
MISRRLGKKILALCATAALGSACTVGPDFQRPQTSASAGYSLSAPRTDAAPAVTFGSDVANNWYQLFRSDALNGLVRQALEANPDLEAARHGLVAAQRELQAVSGTALPQIDATGNIGRQHINGSFLLEPVNGLDATGNRFALGPSMAYDLDVFGGIRRSIEAQGAAASNVRDQTLNTYITLVDQVVEAAFNFASTEAQIKTTEDLIADLRDQYNLTQTLENAGKITRSDTYQAKTQLANTEATLPGLEQQRDVYRNALAQLCGRTPDEFVMPAVSLRDFAIPRQVPVSVPSDLVRHRPDILAAEDLLHEASARIGVATAARLPSFSISGQYAQQTTFAGEFFKAAGGVWSFGPQMAAPIFQGGTLAARQKEAREQYLQAASTYRSTVLAAFVEVANTLRALEHDGDSYLAHNRALEAARQNRDLANAQYRAGRYTELQVLTAEQQYQDAVLSQVHADAQRFTDIAGLFHALGGGWWNASEDPSLQPVASTQSVPIAPRKAVVR